MRKEHFLGIAATGWFLALDQTGNRQGAAMSSSPWDGPWKGDGDVASPSVSGVAMSSSPGYGLWMGDEDVDAPFLGRGLQAPAAASARRRSMVLRKTEVSKGLARTSEAPRVLAISRYSPAGTRPPPEMAITGSFGSVRLR